MSEKVLSVRMAKREAKYSRKEVEMDQLKVNPLGLLLWSFALLAEVYLIVKYLGIEISAIYSVILFILGFSALIGVLWLTKGRFITYELPFIKSGWHGMKYLLGIFSLVAAIGIMMILLQASFRYALETIDIYFYYLAAAVLEETFFRLFLISFFIKILSDKIGRMGAAVIGVFISSLVFMLAHWSAYGHSAYLMSSMLLGGVIFSIYYLAFKDITITMLGHLIINLIVVATTLMVV